MTLLSAANDPAAPAPAAFARREADLPLEGGTDPIYGSATWKTLVCASRTPSSELVFGVAILPAHGTLNPHRHRQAEVYFCLDGAAQVTIDGVAHDFAPGTALFVPGDAEHGTLAGPAGVRFAYAFACDAFGEVDYRFTGPAEMLGVSAA